MVLAMSTHVVGRQIDGTVYGSLVRAISVVRSTDASLLGIPPSSALTRKYSMDGAFKSPRLDIRMYVLAITIQVIRLTCTQHGQPVLITDVGETALDEEIFEE